MVSTVEALTGVSVKASYCVGFHTHEMGLLLGQQPVVVTTYWWSIKYTSCHKMASGRHHRNSVGKFLGGLNEPVKAYPRQPSS